MTIRQNDSVWQQFIQSVKPLKKKSEKQTKPLPPYLCVHKSPERILAYELDLHGLTIEEAYQSLKRFVTLHVKSESRYIRVITGKGIEGKGKIKNEIMLWLETSFFRDIIRQTCWLNDGGVLEIILKRKKKSNGRKDCSRD